MEAGEEEEGSEMRPIDTESRVGLGGSSAQAFGPVVRGCCPARASCACASCAPGGGASPNTVPPSPSPPALLQAVLLVGYMRDELDTVQQLLLDMEADMVKVCACVGGQGGCRALPCPALPCPALPCPALPCPALPCPALPRQAGRDGTLRGGGGQLGGS
jgi:hypothetical protein